MTMQQSELPDIVSRVFDFNYTVVGIQPPNGRGPRVLERSEVHWLRAALVEEADEMAYGSDEVGSFADLVSQVDACVDSAIFAIGGLCRMGLTEEQATQIFHIVMDANFKKKSGSVAHREGAADAQKPEGWVGPEGQIEEVLKNGE